MLSASGFRLVGQPQAEVFDVVDGFVEELGHVAVVEAVDDAAAGASAGDQAQIPQQA